MNLFDELCQEVHIAATHHDAHVMFSIINKYSNKRPLVRTRLRTADGRIADQYQSHAMLADFVRTTWQGPCTIGMEASTGLGVPFTETELAEALARVHLNKSVAQPFLPAAVWRSAPNDVAHFLMGHLEQWWTHNPPLIPQCWRDSWLFFLPKPGKANTHPSHLRPISLMEPLGKIVMGLLAKKLKQCIGSHLCQYPHFGFLPMRAATDAVNRVATHCRNIRALVSNGRRTVANQRAGNARMPICGGLSLFVDLERAFDTVNRRFLFQHLDTMEAPVHLVSLIRTWHEHTHYNLIFQGHTYPIPVGQGVRQGCKIAPLLWLIYMDCFLVELMPLTGPEWIMSCFTLYADDLHIGCQFTTATEFQLHLVNFGHVLNVLERLQLRLSCTKSFVMLATSGTNPRGVLKHVVHRSKNGLCIRIPRNGQHTMLPVRSTASYLGVIMSYRAFEEATWIRRRNAGWSAYQRLSKWLKAKRLPIQHRLYLWHTCIHTVLTYGLLAVQLTPKVLHDYQSVIYRMIRGVIGDHSYCTHRTHQQAFQAHHIPEPLVLLEHLAMKLQQRLGRRSQVIASADVLHQVDWSHLLDTLCMIRRIQQHSSQVTIDPDPGTQLCTQAMHKCPHCTFHTCLLPNLRRHLTTCHSHPILRTTLVDYLGLAMHGRPQCSHCHRMFTTWRSFCIHIQRDCCQVSVMEEFNASSMGPPMAQLPQGLTLDSLHVATQPFWPILKDIVTMKRWHDLGPEHEVGEHLTHTCFVCGTWINRFQELHSHLRLHHSDLLMGGVAKGAQLTAILGDDSPCLLCSAGYQRVHSCPVTLQVGILHILAAQEDALTIARRCDICNQDHDTLQQLYRHLFQEHELTINDWCPARDALAAGDACAHCGAVFDSRSGLRRHITEGRCMDFDPLASSQTCDVDSTWGEILRQGNVSKGSLSAIQRLRLTTQCQLCGMSYDRQGDLVAHLLQSHGPVWQRSQPALRFLLQTIQSHHGCLCNPMSNEFSVTHVCVGLRQIAMLFEQSSVNVLVPHQFLETALRPAFASIANDPMVDRLIQTLIRREFDHLWTAPEFLTLLRSRCVLCGGFYRPASMMHHLLTMHPDEHKWAAQILFQITACMRALQSNDHQCSCCGLIYNLPVQSATGDVDRSLAQAAHFDFSCPVARQIGVLLLPTHGHVDLGSTRSGVDGQSSIPGALVIGHTKGLGRKRRRPAHQTTQASQSRRRPERQDGHSGGHDDHAQGGGATGDQSREEHEPAVPSGLLRFVRPVRSTGCLAHSTATGDTMEGAEPAEGFSTRADHEDVSSGGHHEGAAQASPTDQLQQGGAVSVGHGHPEGHDLSGRGVDLPTMVHGSTSTHPGQEGVIAYATNAEDAGTSGGSAAAQHARGEVSQLEEPRRCDPMVPPGHITRPGVVDVAELHHSQHGVESAGHDGQATQPTDVSASSHARRTDGQGLPGPLQRTGQREDQEQVPEAEMTSAVRSALRQRCAQLVMGNSGTLCYANSALQSFLWACLSRVDFQYSDWGALSIQFRDMLTQVEPPIHLDRFDWFQALVAHWSDQHSQADSAEFSHRLLSQVNTAVVSNEWHRMVFLGENAIVHNIGAKCMPLTLQIDPSLIEHDETQLSTLLRLWHTELGMMAGFAQETDIVVIHLDRFVRSPTGRLNKLNTAIRFCWEILVPFIHADATCHWDSFQVIAAFSHHGTQDSGHYTTTLRTFPEVTDLETPTLWLHCDDHRMPERCLTLPAKFENGVTCFWLCRSAKFLGSASAVVRSPGAGFGGSARNALALHIGMGPEQVLRHT